MIENLNTMDKKILANLLPKRGDTTFHIFMDLGTTQAYAFQRLQILAARGLVVKSIKGRSAAWGIHPNMKKTIASSLGLPWKDIKKELKKLGGQTATEEADGWIKRTLGSKVSA